MEVGEALRFAYIDRTMLVVQNTVLRLPHNCAAQ